MTGTFSNTSRRDFIARRRELAAAFLSGSEAPPVSAAVAGIVTRCRHAEDTGEAAFLRLPCRGNRIRCLRMPETFSFTRNCQPNMCRFYEEAAEENAL